MQSWHLELFARLFDLCSIWWCVLDILKFLPVYLIFVPFIGAILTSWNFCPFIWSLFHLVVRSWYFIIGTTGVRNCNLDNTLKSEWDQDYRSSCDLDILNYELFGPFSGWLRSWYFAVHFLIIIFLGKENVDRIPSPGISLAFPSLPSFFLQSAILIFWTFWPVYLSCFLPLILF